MTKKKNIISKEAVLLPMNATKVNMCAFLTV